MRKKGSLNKHSRKILSYCKTCKKQILVYPCRLKIGKGKFCSQKCGAIDRIDKLRQRSIGNKWNIGRHHTKEAIDKIIFANKGKRRPNISKSKIGKLNPNWKGGISPINKRIRRSAKFFEWRKKVFERDNWTCQECKQRGCILHPDHIKRFSDYPELRFEINNGRTLCKNCHLKTSTYGNRKEQK